MSLIVKVGKAGKKVLKKLLQPAEKHHLSYTRRIERVKTARHICAMTFDDGPMDIPASPDRFGGKSLTDVILDTFKEHGGKGTFDVVGDTSENYPDTAGKPGSAAWGGIKYDHYPDIGKDASGGAVHNSRLIGRILYEGHQITNHGYRHIIFGKKPFVYGNREFLGSLDKALSDIQRLHGFMKDNYGYEMTMSRPPHYVDIMQDGFTSYDVYDAMGYQYMAASYDGAGWLPSTAQDPEEALKAEVNAMVEPMRKLLEKDPDYFCGQIIFQKDGYNMSRRTPVAFALSQQLELLKKYGYEVVTVDDLMQESPFMDIGREDALFEKFVALSKNRAVAYSDNRVRLDDAMTAGELAMLLSPRDETISRRVEMIRASKKRVDAYAGAISYCVERGLLPKGIKSDAPISALPEKLFAATSDFTRRGVYAAYLMTEVK